MTIGSNDWNGLTLSNGRYLITAKLGEGGMGFVYRAVDRNIEAEVVIKVPRRAMMEDPEFAGRFTREIRSLVKLSHPHIVKVTDVGTWEGTPFAVMQFLSGGSLEDIRPTGPGRQPLSCDSEKVSRWLAAVAEALDYVHAQGYVHRDVKPGNILFDAHGHSFLSDFGVAKVLSTSPDTHASQTGMTGAGMVLGTPEYMAPELIMGEPFDGRVDQYALAVTAYELLCGRRPFEDETKTRVLVLHSTKAPPRLTDWRPALTERVSQAVLKGLAKDPNERHPSCAALVAAIAGAVSRDDRVRIQCPGCGKVGFLGAADFARLKESGRRIACSACKAPLDVSDAGTTRVAPPAGSGATMAVSNLGRSGEQVRTWEPGPNVASTTALSARGGSDIQTPPRLPKTEPSGTTALSAPGSQGREVLDGEAGLPPARRASRTVIERPLSPSRDDPATAVLKAPAISEPDRPKPPAPDEARGADGLEVATSDRTRTWIAFGAGAMGSLLVLSLMFWAIVLRKETKTAALQPVPQTPPVLSATAGSTPTSTTTPSDRLESPANTPAPRLSALPRPTGPDPARGSLPDADAEKTQIPTGSSTHVSQRDTRRPPANLVPPRPSPPVAPSPGKVNAVDARPPDTLGRSAFDLTLLDRPKRVGGPKITLKKLLEERRAYANHVVVPIGMFYLAPDRVDRSGGPRKYVVTEQQLRSRDPRGHLEIIPVFSTDLVLDPKLAENLASLSPNQRDKKPTILTVWVTEAGDCVLVKAEILQKTSNRIHGRFRADIDYWTLLAEPRGVPTEMKGVDADWEQLERLLLLKNHYKKQIELLKMRFQNAEYAQVMLQMNSVFQSSMQSVLSQQSMQQNLQRQLAPR
jgi:hypothetical protein